MYMYYLIAANMLSQCLKNWWIPFPGAKSPAWIKILNRSIPIYAASKVSSRTTMETRLKTGEKY